MSGELTGYKRKIKDNVLDLLGCVKDWKKYHNLSISHLNNVAANKLDLISKKIICEDTEKFNTYSDTLKFHIDNLCETYEKMEEQNDKMQEIAKRLQALAPAFNLERSFREDEEENLVFNNFTWDQYVSKVTTVAKMFSEEAKIKKEIITKICHVDEQLEGLDYDGYKNIITAMQSAWRYEPCINEDDLENAIRPMLMDCLNSKNQIKDAYDIEF